MQIQSLPEGALHERTVFLSGPEAKHVLKVRRLSVGDPVVFADGEGRFLHTRIDRCGPTELHAEIERIEEDPREKGAPWSMLGLALLKGDHFELALEKAVELGVHRIIPLQAERCVVRWKDKGGRKLERWRRIAESAMKQSGRSWMPRVDEPCPLPELSERVGDGVLWVVADEEEESRRVDEGILLGEQGVLGLVGPEGAFSPDEKHWLAERNALAVSLSPYRLRSETAAITLMAALHEQRLRAR